MSASCMSSGVSASGSLPKPGGGDGDGAGESRLATLLPTSSLAPSEEETTVSSASAPGLTSIFPAGNEKYSPTKYEATWFGYHFFIL